MEEFISIQKTDVLSDFDAEKNDIYFKFFRETKIVLKGENSAQLTDLAKQAETKGVANYMVQDAGRTQVSELCLFDLILYVPSTIFQL